MKKYRIPILVPHDYATGYVLDHKKVLVEFDKEFNIRDRESMMDELLTTAWLHIHKQRAQKARMIEEQHARRVAIKNGYKRKDAPMNPHAFRMYCVKHLR